MKEVLALRKEMKKYDGKTIAVYTEKPLRTDLVHYQRIHYYAHTACNFKVTKKMRKSGNYKEVTCPECLTALLERFSRERDEQIRWITEELEFQKQQKTPRDPNEKEGEP